jgi:hypothetical protein
LISSNFIVFSLLPVSACFFFHLERQRGKTRRHRRRDETEREGGWQGVSGSAASAKRGWFVFGMKPAQSETPAGAAAKRRPPGRGEVDGRREATVSKIGLAWQAILSSLMAQLRRSVEVTGSAKETASNE